MAIEYQLDISTESPVEDIATAVAACFPSTPSETGDSVWITAAENVQVSVMNSSPSELVTQYVACPTATVLFRLNKFDLEAARLDVARAVAHLLREFPGDMLLRWNWEKIAALRSGTDLLISNDLDLKTQLVHHLNIPYRLGVVAERSRDGDS